MKQIISILVSVLTLSSTVSAQTIDNIDFSTTNGGFTVNGKTSAERVSFELLEKYMDGSEETRLEYVSVANAENGIYSHDIKLKNPNGLYVLKVNDGSGEISEKVMYLGSKLASDGISTEMPGTLSVGDRVTAEVNVRNYTNSDITLYYTAAFYNDNGKLLGVTVDDISVENGQKETDFVFEVPAIPGIDNVSIIVMDDEMHPLGASKTAKVSEYAELYVSPGANGDGSESSPLGDIESALDLAYELETDTVIYLREGDYTSALNINGMRNITLAAYPGEKVTFTNASTLNSANFTAVTDSEIYNRLPSGVRGSVKELDLTATGINDAGIIPKISYGSAEVQYDVLTINSERATIARWPNEGYTNLYSGTAADDTMTFKYIYTRGENWLNVEDIWVVGYWSNGWSQYSMPATIEKISGTLQGNPYPYYYQFTTDGSAGSILGGLPAGRFYVFNIPEELDTKGEYFIDTETNKLYLLPPDNFDNAEISLAYSENTMMNITNSSNINIMGINFEEIKGMGIYGENVSDMVVYNCDFKNVSGDCVRIFGTDSIVSSCKIDSVGSGGIHMEGGTRATLTSGNNIVENNEISDYGQDYRVYNPAVSVTGVGATIAHNKIYDAPHAAIQFSGNEHIIEYNDIRNVMTETGDAGAIYGGRNLLGNGNIIRYNYFEGLERVSITDEYGTTIKYSAIADVVCVYLDDLFSGATVHGNIMNNVDIGVLIGGGSNNVITNNIIMNRTGPELESFSIAADARGIDGRDISSIVATANSIPYKSGVWAYKYPENLISMSDENLGMPINNTIKNNAYFNHNDTNIHQYVSANGTYSGNKGLSQEPGFYDYSKGDFRLTNDAYIYSVIPDFEYIPFEKIGLR